MCIDELIKFCKDKSENIKLKAEPQVFIEIAEKLEELKAIKYDNVPIIHGKSELELHDKQVRAKAIDEFVKKICEKYTEEESKRHYKQYCVNIKQEIADIAEQLKGSK